MPVLCRQLRRKRCRMPLVQLQRPIRITITTTITSRHDSFFQVDNPAAAGGGTDLKKPASMPLVVSVTSVAPYRGLTFVLLPQTHSSARFAPAERAPLWALVRHALRALACCWVARSIPRSGMTKADFRPGPLPRLWRSRTPSSGIGRVSRTRNIHGQTPQRRGLTVPPANKMCFPLWTTRRCRR